MDWDAPGAYDKKSVHLPKINVPVQIGDDSIQIVHHSSKFNLDRTR